MQKQQCPGRKIKPAGGVFKPLGDRMVRYKSPHVTCKPQRWYGVKPGHVYFLSISSQPTG